MYYIYFLRDENDNVKYVGQTKDPTTRKRDHKKIKPQHIFEIIEETDIAENAKNLEIEYIKKHNTYKTGWNKSPGGEGFDEYDRKGIGGANKGNIPWNKGVKNCFSQETIEKMKKNNYFLGFPFSAYLNESSKKNTDSIFDSWIEKSNSRKSKLISIFSKKQLQQLKKYIKQSFSKI